MRILLLALSFVFLAACSEDANHMSDNKEQITVETGRKFAGDLVSGRFTEARSLLSQKLQKVYTPEALAARYRKMIEYWEGKPAKVGDYYTFTDQWPARQPQDIGWAYISIEGDGYVEAVTVTVTDESGSPRISELEWGRP